MKKILLTVREEALEKIKPILEEKLHYIQQENELVRTTIYVPDVELDELINEFQERIDFRYKNSMIEVYTPDFVVSSALKRAEKKADSSQEKTPVEKLIDSTIPHIKLDINKIALTSVAGIIALTGLYMDNVAIIIGAMLLSPLLGPIYSFSINTAVGKARQEAYLPH